MHVANWVAQIFVEAKYGSKFIVKEDPQTTLAANGYTHMVNMDLMVMTPYILLH